MPRLAHTPDLHPARGLALLAALMLTPVNAAPPPEADRAAILSMQGEYTVKFAFHETVALAHGYERTQPYHSGGDEVVILLENSPGKLVLQHLLLHVPSGHVVKHWRQDWIYEATRRLELTADKTWRWRDLPAQKVPGSWTQCVYEVSDAPRYCGSGHWTHANGISTWTSDPSWRPLPRREHTKRHDYNALHAINRHTIVPEGWTHEQDNTKAIRDQTGVVQRVIVRESGFNDYRHTREVDFSPVYAYWRATSDYWARVRAHWDQRLQSATGIQLATERDGMALIEPLFQHAKAIVDGGTVDEAELEALFRKWVHPADAEKDTAAH